MQWFCRMGNTTYVAWRYTPDSFWQAFGRQDYVERYVTHALLTVSGLIHVPRLPLPSQRPECRPHDCQATRYCGGRGEHKRRKGLDTRTKRIRTRRWLPVLCCDVSSGRCMRISIWTAVRGVGSQDEEARLGTI